jgi:hypothetical protein
MQSGLMNYVGFLLALLTATTLLYSAFILVREYLEKKRSNASSFQPHNTTSTPVLPYIAEAKKATENEIKGAEFEKFVVEKFDKNYFRCIDWRSDKHHNGVYPLSNTYPDLAMEYKDKTRTIPFAIECKWRAAFRDDAIQWATGKQIDNYFGYQNKKRHTVFIVIGVGGTPGNPSELYIIPLNNLHSRQSFLLASFLQPYKRHNANSSFFLDTSSMQLK